MFDMQGLLKYAKMILAVWAVLELIAGLSLIAIGLAQLIETRHYDPFSIESDGNLKVFTVVVATNGIDPMIYGLLLIISAIIGIVGTAKELADLVMLHMLGDGLIVYILAQHLAPSEMFIDEVKVAVKIILVTRFFLAILIVELLQIEAINKLLVDAVSRLIDLMKVKTNVIGQKVTS